MKCHAQFRAKMSATLLRAYQIKLGRATTLEIGDLAINAAPVAGIVGIQVDAYGHAARSAGNHGINVSESRNIAAVVTDLQ